MCAPQTRPFASCAPGSRACPTAPLPLSLAHAAHRAWFDCAACRSMSPPRRSCSSSKVTPFPTVSWASTWLSATTGGQMARHLSSLGQRRLRMQRSPRIARPSDSATWRCSAPTRSRCVRAVLACAIPLERLRWELRRWHPLRMTLPSRRCADAPGAVARQQVQQPCASQYAAGWHGGRQRDALRVRAILGDAAGSHVRWRHERSGHGSPRHGLSSEDARAAFQGNAQRHPGIFCWAQRAAQRRPSHVQRARAADGRGLRRV